MKYSGLLLAFSGWIGSALVSIPAAAQTKYDYHAVFIYNFSKYIEWPEDKVGNSFVIGVFGDSPLQSILTQLVDQRKIGNNPITVRRLRNPAEVASCHIVFFSAGTNRDFEASKPIAQSKGVLTVTESPGMGRKGAGINFIIVEGKLKFEINRQTLTDSHLNASGQLYTLGLPIN